jgi:hypothetical protein
MSECCEEFSIVKNEGDTIFFFFQLYLVSLLAEIARILTVTDRIDSAL